MEEDRKDSSIEPIKKESDPYQTQGDREPRPQMLSAWNYFSLGIEFAFIFGILVWIGSYLDSYLSWRPVFTMIGALLGFGLGITHIIRRTKN